MGERLSLTIEFKNALSRTAGFGVKLETGRTHQIRVHLSEQKMPLVGDAVYGGRLRIPKGASEDLQVVLRGFSRQALHARSLSLIHPATGEQCSWECPLPDDMLILLSALRQPQQRRVNKNVISANWSLTTGVNALMTCRYGGKSAGGYQSNNLGIYVGDEHAPDNRRALVETLKLPSEPLWLKQVHGTACHYAAGLKMNFNLMPFGLTCQDKC